MDPHYKSVEEMLAEWPLELYSAEELEKIHRSAKEGKKELTIRLWGNEYVTFRADGGIDPFEYEEIEDDGTLKMPPRDDKGVVYDFKFVIEGQTGWLSRTVLNRLKLD